MKYLYKFLIIIKLILKDEIFLYVQAALITNHFDYKLLCQNGVSCKQIYELYLIVGTVFLHEANMLHAKALIKEPRK